jgi:hypothetical protein
VDVADGDGVGARVWWVGVGEGDGVGVRVWPVDAGEGDGDGPHDAGSHMISRCPAAGSAAIAFGNPANDSSKPDRLLPRSMARTCQTGFHALAVPVWLVTKYTVLPSGASTSEPMLVERPN